MTFRKCPNLMEVCLDGFMDMESLSIHLVPILKNLYLRNMPAKFTKIDIDSAANLKYLEVFLESALSC